MIIYVVSLIIPAETTLSTCLFYCTFFSNKILLMNVSCLISFRKSFFDELEGDGEQKHALSKLITQIRDLEKDLKRQTEINGITLNECFVKRLNKSEISVPSVMFPCLGILLLNANRLL